VGSKCKWEWGKVHISVLPTWLIKKNKVVFTFNLTSYVKTPTLYSSTWCLELKVR
jgi:hypothetical protein